MRIALLSYSALLTPIYLLAPPVPDEIGYSFAAAHDRPHLNHLGYGELFWWYRTLLHLIFGKSAFVAARLLTLIQVILIAYFIFLIVRDVSSKNAEPGRYKNQYGYAFSAMLLWLFMPIAHWFGKVTGPELLALFIGLSGIKLSVSNGKTRWGAFLLGACVATKINFLTLFLLGYLLTIPLNASFYSVLGFLLASPLIVYSPSLYMAPILAEKLPSCFTLAQLKKILFQNTFEWDCVSNFGFFTSGFPVLAFLSWIILMFWGGVSSKRTAQFFLAIAFTLFLLLSNGRFYQWYLIPLLPLFPLSFAYLKENRLTSKLVALTLALTLVFSLPTIVDSYRSTAEYALNRYTSKHAYRCFDEILPKIPFEHVVDVSEIEIDHSSTYLHLYRGPDFLGNLSGLRAIKFNRFQGGRTLVLLGKRIDRIHPYLRPLILAQKISSTGACGYIDYFVVNR